MSTPVPYDQQYCPIARGLDMLGDRWTLLIVRELGNGPQRFSDLQRHLPGIAATVLSDRLRAMSQDGLVESVAADPPSTRNRYALGPLGRRALPVLSALVRFGMPLLEPPTDLSIQRPSLTVRAAIVAYWDAAAAADVDVDERYEIRADHEVFCIDSRARTVTAGASAADLVITSPSKVWIDIRQHRTSFDDLVRQGVITCVGPRKALAHFRAIYRLSGGPGGSGGSGGSVGRVAD